MASSPVSVHAAFPGASLPRMPTSKASLLGRADHLQRLEKAKPLAAAACPFCTGRPEALLLWPWQ